MYPVPSSVAISTNWLLASPLPLHPLLSTAAVCCLQTLTLVQVTLCTPALKSSMRTKHLSVDVQNQTDPLPPTQV